MNKLTKFIIKFKNFLNKFQSFNGFSSISFSQEGEDLILARLFAGTSEGIYVDVGAHHPKRFSNTYYFYLLGWRGINVDPRPQSMALFERYRPNDINLEIAVFPQGGRRTYYQFEDPALNSFSADLVSSRENIGVGTVINKSEINGQPLNQILASNLHLLGCEIDFLTVDAEGLDYEVLLSNDWDKFRPKIVLVEILMSSLDSIFETPAYKLMVSVGYSLYAKSVNTVFFIEKKMLEKITPNYLI